MGIFLTFGLTRVFLADHAEKKSDDYMSNSPARNGFAPNPKYYAYCWCNPGFCAKSLSGSSKRTIAPDIRSAPKAVDIKNRSGEEYEKTRPGGGWATVRQSLYIGKAFIQ